MNTSVIIGVISTVILILVIIVYFVFFKKNDLSNNTPPTATTTQTTPTTSTPITPLTTPTTTPSATTTQTTPTTSTPITPPTTPIIQNKDCSGSWTEWSACDKTCGGGLKKRTYSIITNKAGSGSDCPYTNNYTDTSSCNTQSCPIDCQVSEWSSWSSCPTCGSGNKTRTRTIITPNANGGALCPALTDTSSCPTVPPCPSDCQTSIWSPWSTCSKTCGGGNSYRTRTILSNASNGGQACPALREDVSCNNTPCATNCQVSEWSNWSVCSKTCGGGTQFRTRTVTTDSSNGGTACPILREEVTCNNQACPITYTSTVEIGSARDNSFNFVCPSNSYITQIYGRYGMWNDAFGVKCSNGSDSGQFGGMGGGAYRTDCPTGFTGASISSNFQGPYIGIIKPQCNGQPMPQSGANSGITETRTLQCPSGSVLGRAFGNYGAYVNKIGFSCIPKV